MTTKARYYTCECCGARIHEDKLVLEEYPDAPSLLREIIVKMNEEEGRGLNVTVLQPYHRVNTFRGQQMFTKTHCGPLHAETPEEYYLHVANCV